MLPSATSPHKSSEMAPSAISLSVGGISHRFRDFTSNKCPDGKPQPRSPPKEGCPPFRCFLQCCAEAATWSCLLCCDHVASFRDSLMQMKEQFLTCENENEGHKDLLLLHQTKASPVGFFTWFGLSKLLWRRSFCLVILQHSSPRCDGSNLLEPSPVCRPDLCCSARVAVAFLVLSFSTDLFSFLRSGPGHNPALSSGSCPADLMLGLTCSHQLWDLTQTLLSVQITSDQLTPPQMDQSRCRTLSKMSQRNGRTAAQKGLSTYDSTLAFIDHCYLWSKIGFSLLSI